jgi:hypothetical protein
MKNTNLIVYSGGSYGTYLEWCLTTLSEGLPIVDPGGPTGNSHLFKGNELSNIDGWNAYYHSESEYKFARIHPKTSADHSLIENVNRLSKETVKIINLYPDRRSYLLVIHNYLTKIWRDLWNGPLGYIRKEDIYNNWDIDPATPLDELPNWIKREYFSFNLFSSWESQVEWYLPDSLSESNNCQYLFVKDLLFDFEKTLKKLQIYLDIEYVQPIECLIEHHEKNLLRQRFINQQSLSESIINSVLYQKKLEWDHTNLTLWSEAWIQRCLREKGFNIRCHGLDKFPDNSTQLTKLIY